MSWVPGYTWPFGYRFSIVGKTPQGHIKIEGKRFWWSKPTQWILEPGFAGAWFWTVHGQELRQMPAAVWAALNHARYGEQANQGACISCEHPISLLCPKCSRAAVRGE